MTYTNEFGQPTGKPVVGWTPRPRPNGETLVGRHSRIERMDSQRHLDALYAVIIDDPSSAWTYMPYGPFESKATFQSWLEAACVQTDPFCYAIVDVATSKAKGLASYLRIEPRSTRAAIVTRPGSQSSIMSGRPLNGRWNAGSTRATLTPTARKGRRYASCKKDFAIEIREKIRRSPLQLDRLDEVP
jgi:hypothetical protein